MGTFRPGDRAVILPNPAVENRAYFWKLCTVTSVALPIGVYATMHRITIDDCPVGDWAINPRYLMPLPKNGPDAHIRSKDRELHA